MINIVKIEGESWICNSYIIHTDSESVIIDPGGDYEQIKAAIGNTQLKAILATHGHYDHIVHVAEMQKEFKAPFYVHQLDSKLIKHANLYVKAFKGKHPIEIPVPDTLILEEETLDFGFIQLQTIHTPGHTEGSVCFLFDDKLFTGDLLLKNRIGRTDFPGGSQDKIKASIKKINSRIGDAVIYPGHKANSSLSEERTHNASFIEITNN
ncbi:MAG: Hydroxyacylglutathione hydrolase [Bacteroidetes bacterium]|jgi:glyoxylase-like metal-dependent hydrolase (beta-lactamase superfamily II)|nr:Hydroxyacylglutathione hydrolase [Bacteroidota bacterium]